MQLLASLSELEDAKGATSYAVKLRDFISLSADVMTIIGPFIPLLTTYIN
jgi:hypothetical protein